MGTVLAFLIGGLYAAGMYMLLRRNLLKLVIGLAMIAHAANLLIFTCIGLTRGRPPLVDEGELVPDRPVADPLAQALVLTAIVISFGVMVFTVVLLYRGFRAVGSSDIHEMRSTEK